MARIRTIKPEFFTHEDLYLAEIESGFPLRIAFAGLWCSADRSGRFKWRPAQLKLAILPYDECDFSRVLDSLTTRGFVVKYASEGQHFGYIPSFERHQVINNRESLSELPEPNENNIIDASSTREPRVSHAACACTRGREGKGREGKENSTREPREDIFEGFDFFWQAWPRSNRKGSKAECLKVWKKKNLENLHKVIIAHVESCKANGKWHDPQYIEAPLVYLNQSRWDGAEAVSVTNDLLRGTI